MAVMRQIFRAPARPGYARRAAITWGLVGFAFATILWSATGHGPGLGVLARGVAPEHTGSLAIDSPKLADRLPGFSVSDRDTVVESNCTALVLDRVVQHTRTADCLANGPEFEFAESDGRQDRLSLPE